MSPRLQDRIVLAVLALVACNVSTACRRADTESTNAAGAAPQVVLWLADGASPRAVACADLDHDRDVDLVVACSGSAKIAVYLGDGRGDFAPAPDSLLEVAKEPCDVACADFDRDGHVDLAVAHHETPLLALLQGDGGGRFRPFPGSPYDTGSRPHVHGIAAADFDGDSHPDVAVDSADDDTARLLRGAPDGLLPPVAVRCGDLPYFGLGAGDVVGDSLAELLVPNQRDRTISILGRPPDTARTASPPLVALAPALALAATPWVVRAADFDGDGRRDLAVVVDDAVVVLRAAPGERFEPVPGSPFYVDGATALAVGDLDADGIADLAVGAWDSADVVVLHGGSFARQLVPVGRRPLGLAVADVDGDGRSDLIAASALDDRVTIHASAAE